MPLQRMLSGLVEAAHNLADKPKQATQRHFSQVVAAGNLQLVRKVP